MNEERWLDRAQDLFYDGKYTRVLKLLDSRFPEPHEEADWLRVESLLGLTWLDAALDTFNRRLREGGADACGRMAGLLQDADALPQAEALLASALADWPEVVDLHLAMANLHFHGGDRARAEQVMGLTGLSLSADDLAARAMLYHGWSMNPSGDDDVVTGRHGIRYARNFLQRALHDLNAALAAGAEPRLLMTRADVHASLGDYDQAAADVEQLMHTMPADHPARTVLAERRDELAAGPAGERQKLAGLLREAVRPRGRSGNRSAEEGMAHDVMEVAAARILAGQDLDSALGDLDDDNENVWIALSIAQQVHSLSQQPAPDWQAVNCREYRRDAVRWANRCRAQLEAQGFRHLGDFEDRNLMEQIGQRVFVRLMLDEAGTTAAAVYSLRVPWPGLRGWLKMALSGQRRRFYMVELESAYAGDTFLITNNSESVDPFEYGDVVEKQSLPHRTSLPALLQCHADGLQRWKQAGRSLQPAVSVEDIIERQDRQRQAKNRYRREIGYVTDRELSGLLGDRFDELAPLVRDKLMELASLQPA